MTYLDSGDKIKCNRKQCKGDGVMVRLMMIPRGLMSHKIQEGKFGSKDYLNYLRTSAVLISKLNYGSN